ncbi:hypothetical protein CkaCkLH20_00042 [Colletotrichum karsti]|uniref:Uncharacterized protein n=1 Tax=Colletotrichum karsti TaxID=1095194 RepID=A0A9P6IIM5_9PEZI|nr:uncharacterized protein CkaCkLH20_00042 [Colletotrichum karsti]KAF9882006.1 hypothetical protein CkaCkLH20_00042 [Colletotrichum karsti]
MHQPQRTRSLTPATEVQRLTDPNALVYKESVLRRYSSTDRLSLKSHNSGSLFSDTTPTSFYKFCCQPQAELALNPPPAKKKPAMLSNLFHPTKGFGPEPQQSLEAAGDFDETPSPSLRPSMADMSLKKPDNDAYSTSSAKSGVFRHALLKTKSGHPTVIDRELPVSPVLSRQIDPDESMEKIREEQRPKESGYENKSTASLPSRSRSAVSTQGTSSEPQFPGSSGESDASAPRERVCVDPLLHPDESHIKAHHRGLLKGADFCDTGVPGQPVPQQAEEDDSDSESDDEVVLARVRRAMTGDDNCLSTVEITLPKEAAGHSRAMKVRPAFNTSTFQYPTIPDNQLYPVSHQTSLGVSKVRPFDASKEHKAPEGDVAGSPSSP